MIYSGDNGLVLKSKAKHAAVAAKLKKPFKFLDRQIVIQYEIAFQVSKKESQKYAYICILTIFNHSQPH